MNDNLIMVKRSGPRGWHWIDRAKFDPAVHERYGVESTVEPVLTADEIELAKLEADEKAKAESDAAEAARIARESTKPKK